jgi:site-specific DNA-methyltransferase (adenine-specific)
MACAIEDAGFEIRDMVSWTYGSGFPKSHDVSKGIDRMLGAKRHVVAQGKPVKRMIPGADQNKGGWEKNNGREFFPTETSAGSPEAAAWEGWGTALKPAVEPICLARKPLSEGTIAANVLKHGTGAINVDGCRIAGIPEPTRFDPKKHSHDGYRMTATGKECADRAKSVEGRWPANLIHDGSEEVLAAFPESGPPCGSAKKGESQGWIAGSPASHPGSNAAYVGDTGNAARFFYTAKADSDDRIGSKHPTVKPVDLMQWLVRLVTPKGGIVLDPFAGTGTTAEACFREGMRCILIERETAYQADIRRRMRLVLAGPDERSRESIKAKVGDVPFEDGTLFAGL